MGKEALTILNKHFDLFTSKLRNYQTRLKEKVSRAVIAISKQFGWNTFNLEEVSYIYLYYVNTIKSKIEKEARQCYISWLHRD